jgi:hypothetical protein
MQEAIIYRNTLEAWLWTSSAGHLVLAAWALVVLVAAFVFLRGYVRDHRRIKEAHRAMSARTGNHVERRFKL